MATIVITIPDAQLARVSDALARQSAVAAIPVLVDPGIS